uniref:G patch domain and KOW motifs-containing protein-like n=1 Tax=Hirondellea gigas TaxID=1518452 RepID=A0A6A7FRR5_9CRUS
MEGIKFSLTFSKKKEQKPLQSSALANVPEKKEEKVEIIELIEDNVIKSNLPEEAELVIPMRQQLQASTFKAKAILKAKQTAATVATRDGSGTEVIKSPDRQLTLDEQAEKALLAEACGAVVKTSREETTAITQSSLTSRLLSTDPSAATSGEVGKLSTIMDYEKVEVEGFGSALLRGMGWKKNEGVGNVKNRRVVSIIDASNKTLGNISTRKQDGSCSQQEQETEQLPLVKGAYVLIHAGRHKANYAVVECIDEDHILVRKAVGAAVLREVEANITVVSMEEYKKCSRVINKEMYDKFKTNIKQKEKERKKRQHSSDGDEQESDEKEQRLPTDRRKLAEQDECQENNSSIKKEPSHISKDDVSNVDDSISKSRNVTQENSQNFGGFPERTQSSNRDRKDEREGKIYEDSGYSSRKEKHSDRNQTEDNCSRIDRDKIDTDKRYSSKCELSSDNIQIVSIRKDNNDHTDDHHKSHRTDGHYSSRKNNSNSSRKNYDSYSSKHNDERYSSRKYEDHYSCRTNDDHHSSQKNEDQYSSKKRSRKNNEQCEEKSNSRKNDDRHSSQTNNNKVDARKGDGSGDAKVSRAAALLSQYGDCSANASSAPWAREGLTVRIISDKYKKGKYYKEKVRVESILTASSCSCRTDAGKLLTDVPPSILETVIPKTEPRLVMLLRGEHSPQVARVLEQHKKEQMASVQLLDDHSVILRLAYEDICQYNR